MFDLLGSVIAFLFLVLVALSLLELITVLLALGVYAVRSVWNDWRKKHDGN